jgi:hypothetical protein
LPPYTHAGTSDSFSNLKILNLPSRMDRVSLFCFIEDSFFVLDLYRANFYYQIFYLRHRPWSGLLLRLAPEAPRTTFLNSRGANINF